MNLALNNLKRLICHKTQPTKQPTNEKHHKKIDVYICMFEVCIKRIESKFLFYHFNIYILNEGVYSIERFTLLSDNVLKSTLCLKFALLNTLVRVSQKTFPGSDSKFYPVLIFQFSISRANSELSRCHFLHV